MPLINCEINLILTLPQNFVISSATGSKKLAITNTKLYVPVVTLSTEDNVELLKQLECDFKRTINWNKYHSKLTEQAKKKVFREQIDFLLCHLKIKQIEKYTQIIIFQKEK